MGRNMILGIDVGSVAASMAVVDRDGGVVATGYRFHRGEVGATVRELLADVDLARIAVVAATGSTPAEVVAARRHNNDLATIAAAKRFHPEMRGLLLVGGERFSFATFDRDGRYLGSRTNTSCAAGTGSFLDQQAVRLNLDSSARLAAIADDCCGPTPKIASRCAVFAKTDLIHAQQEGHTLEGISDGLCQGLAKNIVDTLFVDGRAPQGEIVFCGGVARNRAVVRHIESLISARLVLPELGHLYGALGACFMQREVETAETADRGETVAEAPRSLDQVVRRRRETTRDYHFPPLSLQLSVYPEFTSAESYLDEPAGQQAVEVDIYRTLTAGQRYPVYLGIDIGSTSTKAVLMAGDRQVLVGLYTRTAGRPLAAVQALLRAIHAIACDKRTSFEVIQCGTTGSGRKFIGRIVGADQMIDEITAHARAAFELNPEVDTIIEIGGQDAKFTTLQHGRVTSSTMNTVCAAGTGSFIEEQAAKLGCRVQEYARRAENQRAPLVSDRCTVFMERDMNHYLSEGYTVDEVLASALHAVRENYLQKVACEHHIGRVVLFQGATARNRALVAAFEQRLARPILVSKFCHLTGALGTALLLQDEAAAATTSFRGIGLYRQPVTISGEVCELCTNHCKISIAGIGGAKVAYGFLCGRDYETKRHVAEVNGAFDLLRAWRRTHRPARFDDARGPSIGLPAAVHMVEDLPMWQQFFAELGIATISSESYSEGLKAGKNLAGAEFCAPMTAMHGHVAWLLDRADYVFLPAYLEEKDPGARRQYCYYTQFLPALAGGGEERVLRPVLRYLYTPFHARIQLYRMLQKIMPERCSFYAVSQAYEHAVTYRLERRRQLAALMSGKCADSDDIQVVLLGRPYTVFGPGMNGKIPDIFRRLGIDAFYKDMLLYDRSEAEGIRPLLDELHWEHAARILEAAEVIGRRANLYPVFLTSFMCTPDAFTLEYFKQVMEGHRKPYLILQLDEHDSSVGYETRIEAAVRSFRNHRQERQRPSIIDYRTINPRLETALDRKYVIFPSWDRITCELLAASLRREGHTVMLIEETPATIREGLRHNSGQCIPLNGVAQGYMDTIRRHGLAPGECTLWLNHSTLACNIRLYPHHIKHILAGHGLGEAGVYVGQLSLADISLRAAANAYFAYMLGGMLRRIACRIRPYELQAGETDRVLDKSIELLSAAFAAGTEKEEALREIVTRFAWIEKEVTDRPKPKVAIFGDIYVRDNRVMNQGLIRFIEAHGGEVITTPYSEYAKMVAPSYFRKWFNEGKYFDLLSYRALLATMGHVEKGYMKILGRVLDGPEHSYDDDPAAILADYHIKPENTGESMDNILKIHYIRKCHPEVSLFVQTSPALCCPSLVTEAMRERIEAVTGVPVVSVTYDGTGGAKNEVILPYLRYPRRTAVAQSATDWPRQRLG